MLDSLFLANKANREGMHANALSLTRQCLESLSVIELGICGHKDAESVLLKWDSDELTAGKLRAWLEQRVWSSYGTGLWHETWATFMREFAAALQPYAHYSSMLAQWQVRLVRGASVGGDSSEPLTALIEARPRAYDAQKATRITLFHAVLTYVLGRIWMANNHDAEFSALIGDLGTALGRSRYLDGHATDWSQQFWAMVWGHEGHTLLE
ncbi:hypothetical protein [Burkholderia pseudomallei]|uniref:hypothetical protein n=1 Tax=Burkholderia pseudomallei TaxID=28450 RepID=UPI0012B16D79|nr:hypothetical protein [Burkholderia pseudomallei]